MIWPGIRLFPDVAPGEPIFGLTMQQPFGSAIIDGPKRIENRPWEPPRRLRGRAFWLAMHAGATLYPDVDRADFTEPPYSTRKAAPALWPACPPFAAMPKRAILGAVRVIGWERLDEGDDRLGPWAFGPVCWHLDSTVIRLAEPLPYARGALGLWRVEPDALAVLRAARDNPACHRRAA
jgi:hypothetical protein